MVFVGEDQLNGVTGVVLLVYCDFFGVEDKGDIALCLRNETGVYFEAEIDLSPYVFLRIVVDLELIG